MDHKRIILSYLPVQQLLSLLKSLMAAGFLLDERFSDYGVLAPKSKADYAFLLHGLYHLKNNGTMVNR